MEHFRARYRGPWVVEHEPGSGFTVRSSAGDRLCHVYYRDLPQEWRVGQFYALNRAEAQCLAETIAGLWEEGKAG